MDFYNQAIDIFENNISVSLKNLGPAPKNDIFYAVLKDWKTVEQSIRNELQNNKENSNVKK